MIGGSPRNKGRGQSRGEPSGFDFVEVQDTAAAPPADATDRVDTGGEASGWSAGFDRAVGRSTAALGEASGRLGSTGRRNDLQVSWRQRCARLPGRTVPAGQGIARLRQGSADGFRDAARPRHRNDNAPNAPDDAARGEDQNRCANQAFAASGQSVGAQISGAWHQRGRSHHPRRTARYEKRWQRPQDRALASG